MSTFMNAMHTSDAYTHNGALTNSTSSNYCLDLFFLAGACRSVSEQAICNKLNLAYNEDRIKTLKIIFWGGDIRQGAGERRFFSCALRWLVDNHPEDISKYVSYVPEYSRWDVLFNLVDNADVFNYIIQEFKKGKDALLFKWLPRKNYATDKKVTTKSNFKNKQVTTVSKTKRSLYNGLAHKIQVACNISNKEYRKYVVDHTQVVETKMCKKQWNEISYSSVPSVAMHKYNKAWYRNDTERFNKYLSDVKSGKKTINASAIFPHDIVKTAITFGGDFKPLSDAELVQWNNLPNYLAGKENSIIPICDVSGSMFMADNSLPIKISIALGAYISERNTGVFKDEVITFSAQPTFLKLSGNLNDRIKQLLDDGIGYNTNLERVFLVLLDKATRNNVSSLDMPKTFLIISDMEFDSAVIGNQTIYESMKNLYSKYGYELPNIVFWNVNGRPGNCPVKYNNHGTALISGASPSIIKAVLMDDINPVNIMNNLIESGRYSFVE